MKIIHGKEFEELKEKINILIITAADCEKEAVNSELNPLDNQNEILLYKYNEYEYYIGKFGLYDVVHVKTDEGNLGSNSSILTMYITLNLWSNLKMVVMMGIACGKKDDRKEIGDILVAEKMFYYEKCKVKEEDGEIIFNGIIGNPLIKSSRRLYQIFENSEDWDMELNFKNRTRKVKIHKGMLFSGEKLINCEKVQNLISKLYSQTGIGFDMEGAGIAYGCEKMNFKEWIVVKSISDFGIGGTISDSNRKKAIKAVINYCKYKFNKKEIFDDILEIESSGEENEEVETIDKEKLMNDNNENYISRKVIQKNKLSYIDTNSKITLYEAIMEKHNKIVLLSDAGSGKTEESKKLVNKILEENKRYVAFYKNLNTYTNKKIVDLVPKELENIDINNIVFVLDRL